MMSVKVVLESESPQ